MVHKTPSIKPSKERVARVLLGLMQDLYIEGSGSINIVTLRDITHKEYPPSIPNKTADSVSIIIVSEH